MGPIQPTRAQCSFGRRADRRLYPHSESAEWCIRGGPGRSGHHFNPCSFSSRKWHTKVPCADFGHPVQDHGADSRPRVLCHQTHHLRGTFGRKRPAKPGAGQHCSRKSANELGPGCLRQRRSRLPDLGRKSSRHAGQMERWQLPKQPEATGRWRLHVEPRPLALLSTPRQEKKGQARCSRPLVALPKLVDPKICAYPSSVLRSQSELR